MRKFQDERKAFEDRIAKKEELIKRLEESSKADSIVEKGSKLAAQIEQIICGELGLKPNDDKCDLVHRLEQLKQTVEKYSEHHNNQSRSLNETISQKQSELTDRENQISSLKN